MRFPNLGILAVAASFNLSPLAAAAVAELFTLAAAAAANFLNRRNSAFIALGNEQRKRGDWVVLNLLGVV